MSATKFRGHSRGLARAATGDESDVKRLIEEREQKIARLEQELSDARQEIERLRAALRSPASANDRERESLRIIWQQPDNSLSSHEVSLPRWLKSLVSPVHKG